MVVGKRGRPSKADKAAQRATEKPPSVRLEALEIIKGSNGPEYYVEMEGPGGRYSVNLADLELLVGRYPELRSKVKISPRLDQRPLLSLKEVGMLLGYRKRMARQKAKHFFRNSPAMVRIEGRYYIRTRMLFDLYGDIVRDAAMLGGYPI